jgi:hypothetical protein
VASDAIARSMSWFNSDHVCLVSMTRRNGRTLFLRDDDGEMRSINAHNIEFLDAGEAVTTHPLQIHVFHTINLTLQSISAHLVPGTATILTDLRRNGAATRSVGE